MKLSVHFILVLTLSVLMHLTGKLFYIDELLSHPQFGAFSLFVELREKALLLKPFYFIGFFVLDFVWAPLLLVLLYRWIKRWGFSPSMVLNYYPIVALLAYGFDFIENTIYLFAYVSGTVLKTVVYLKMGFYVPLFLAFLLLLAIRVYRFLVKT